MRKYILIFLLFILVLLPCSAESDFKLDLLTDSILLGVSGSAAGLSLLTGTVTGAQQSFSEINPVDSSFMFPYSQSLDDGGTLGAAVMLILPCSAAVGKLDDSDALITYAVMYAEAFLMTVGTKDLIKDFVPRWRPWTYSGESIPADSADELYDSFPSGHTAYAFLGASFFSALILNDYKDEAWAPWASAASYVIASTVAGLRVASGEHFVTDVFAGAAVGSLFGWIIPLLHISNSTAEKSSGSPVVSLSSNSISIGFSY